MAARRKTKRTERSKLDATPPWEPKRTRDQISTSGPFDLADAPEDDLARVDLGTLRIPAHDALELRLELDEQRQVSAVAVVGPTGQMQLGLYAAPRNEGIWPEVRAEIIASIHAQGGTAAELEGEYGTELTAKLPAERGFTPVRFIGFDGPRWFLRAMLSGAAATTDSEAQPFIDVLRNVIVVRGTDALPVREPVPLKLPADTAQQLAAAVEQEAAEATGP